MLLFSSTPKPIWRQTWLRLLLLSGSTLGALLLVMPRLSSEWLSASENTNEPPVELRQVNPDGIIRPYLALSQLSHGLTERVLEKAHAAASYRNAIALAEQALALRKQGSNLELSQQEKALWQQAIQSLQAVDSRAAQYPQAQAKLKEYGNVATFVSHRISQQRSDFLIPIASASGNPNMVRISLCQLGTSECRSFRGDVPPASLASLVKLPIAVALMHQVTNGQANLDEQLYIDPSNFTENAQGAKIFVDKTYTLREVMVRMITESNNIATNQLIDYMGYETINSALKAEGFASTTVGHKLVGDSTYPKRMGSGKNRSTADELTQMMMRIYSFTKASDEEILDALVGQYDLDFGYRALIKEKPEIFWIGEKTGQNSSVIGTTVAFKVKEERYVMTVTIDRSANQGRLRQIIRDVAQYLLENGPLNQQPAPTLARRL
ncbi:beta-lactamase class a [Leptolyngbya sp. Heron Island J]|uniref:serine hydrolase n=1 Tax=Leptolyngbya sp. Heron Island J TaxID=1385935 RepID=UPI0003B94AFF|nr:serine hydrolase [Leptolyngbya sp. Heron Island J]ESA38911.1 beta-lactamase class a [Leptolyngbya sp. Heron Island J]